MFKEFGSELHETLDVWMIYARAHGKGLHRSTKAPPQYLPGGDLYAGHGFDAMILEDMDPVLARIREVTGFPKVALIGHSMGGMVEKAYLRGASGRAGIVRGFDPELARQRSEQVLQLFTIGSPWHFRDMPAYLEFLTHALRLIPDSPEFMLPTVGPEQAPTIADPEGLRAGSVLRLETHYRIGMPLFPPARRRQPVEQRGLPPAEKPFPGSREIWSMILRDGSNPPVDRAEAELRTGDSSRRSLVFLR